MKILNLIWAASLVGMLLSFTSHNSNVGFKNGLSFDKEIIFIDTSDFKGTLVLYLKKGSDDVSTYGLKIFIPEKEDSIVKKLSLNVLIQNGFVYLHSSHFLKLLFASKESEKYKHLNYDKESSIRGHIESGSQKIKSGTLNYFKVDTKFLIVLVKSDYYKSVFWTEKGWFCDNSYIVVVTPFSLIEQ